MRPPVDQRRRLRTDTAFSVGLTRLESNRYRARSDQAAEAVAGFEFDFDVLRMRIGQVTTAFRTVWCTAQNQAMDNVLNTEVVELQVHDFTQRKGHDSMAIEHEVAIPPNFASV